MSLARLVTWAGATHIVDSNDLSFRLAAIGAVRQGRATSSNSILLRSAVTKAGAVVLEPVMSVEVSAPEEYQGSLVGIINKRKGSVVGTDAKEGYATIMAQVISVRSLA